MLFTVFLHKAHIWEKSCACHVVKNAFNQSGCRIFKSTITPEQIDEIA